jgi:hypothetical protein
MSAQTRHTLPGTLPVVAKVSTPWGAAAIVEEIVVPQRAGAKRFSTRVELLETRSGERLVRLSYATDGTARRGPVTVRERDLARLVAAIARTTELRRALASARAP